MNLSIFPHNHVPPTQFYSADYLGFKKTIRNILDPHRTFIKEQFNRGNLVSLKGYALDKVVNGHYEELSNLEICLLMNGLEYLGCVDGEAPKDFRRAISCHPGNMSILWLADIEPNLILRLQLYNRFAKTCKYGINAHIYNFRDNLRYYGYFEKGCIFFLHEVDPINNAQRITTRCDLIKVMSKLSKYLKRAGCEMLLTGGNVQKLMRE